MSAVNNIFIVGCPRSGTTLLQSMLTTQAVLTTFTESHFFETMFHSRRLFGRTVQIPNEVYRKMVTPFLEENGFGADESLIEQWPGERAARRLLARTYSRRFLRLLDVLATRRGASGWVEKTPGHLHAIDYIRSVRSSVTFVHVVRDARETVASLLEASPRWGDSMTPMRAARRWRDDLFASAAFVGQPGQCHLLYEDLVARPADAIRGVCASLALPFDESLLQKFNEVARIAVHPTETWKTRNFAATVESRVGHSTAKPLEIDAAVDTLMADNATRQALARIRQASAGRPPA